MGKTLTVTRSRDCSPVGRPVTPLHHVAPLMLEGPPTYTRGGCTTPHCGLCHPVTASCVYLGIVECRLRPRRTSRISVLGSPSSSLSSFPSTVWPRVKTNLYLPFIQCEAPSSCCFAGLRRLTTGTTPVHDRGPIVKRGRLPQGPCKYHSCPWQHARPGERLELALGCDLASVVFFSI